MTMKYSVQFLIILFGFYLTACNNDESATVDTVEHVYTEEAILEEEYTSDQEMQNLYDNHVSDEQVMIQAEVIKNLADDNEGSRHQKFIVKLASEQTILVSHNIDLADRIENLQEGDEVTIYGEYEWNDRGGVIHWTHHDPDGQHIGGWIKHHGDLYE
jgi:hypothetical protein